MQSESNDFLPTRWSLLSRLKDWDDQDSWRQFFDTYWKLIYYTALKAGLNHTEAEEVVQEVVISVAKKMGEFKTNAAAGSFKSWLLNITQWRITDQLRKRGREQARRQPPSADPARTSTVERVPDPHAADLENTWNEEWQRNLVESALERVKARVKPELFQIFDLLINKQWTAQTVSKRLHVSLTQVYYAKCKVTLAMKQEIKKLERQGF